MTDKNISITADINAHAVRLELWAGPTLSSQVINRNDHHRIFLLAQGVRIFRSFQAIQLNLNDD